MKTVLVAIGGNAIFDLENGNNVDPFKLEAICTELLKVVELGYRPVITFGNGPQVGNLLEMTEQYIEAPRWPIPLDVCVAWTQAEIGYQISKALQNTLTKAGHHFPILELNTTVVVDKDDPAFYNATKYVGNFFTEADAERVTEERGWEMKPDSNRGWRRVVPSPRPVRIVEESAIRLLLEGGCIVLCGGGGGIPVIEEDGDLRGVEAVIDKDYTACLLATRLGIPEIVICTAIDRLYLDFGTPDERPLDVVALDEAKAHLADGQFPPGSMGPKVEALIHYLEAGGQRATLTLLDRLSLALAGLAGTRFVPTLS